jgi:malonyl-CoA/methylmalonyl-CoA synthetase
MAKPSYITDYLIKNAQQMPDKLALVDHESAFSWRELAEAVEPIAKALRAKFPGDEQVLIGVFMPNSWEYIVAYLAIIHAGHVAVPIDVIYKELEIDAIINQMNPAIIITDQAGQKRISDSPKATLLSDVATSEAAPPPLRIDPRRQIATIFFTSGTTGKPKAVPNTHANHIWNIQTCSKVWQWTDSDSLLISVRLTHMLGCVMGLSGVLYHGNTFYITDRFDAEKILALLEKEKISMFSYGPLVYAKLLEVEKDYDLSKVRLFISGSGPLPPSTWQAFKDRYGQEILEVYGSSETGRIASNLLDERIPGSPGRPLPDVQIKVEDNGELAVKSPGVFPGYYNNAELTNKNLTPDGFWRTGDIVEIHDGRIILKGRIHEIIRRLGYSVSPRDVEWAMHKFPAVKDIAVLGEQRATEAGDKIVYFVVTEAGQDDIMAYCRENLPSIWRPDQIIIVDELPKNKTGKTDINALRAMLN